MAAPVQVRKQVEEAEALARELGMDNAPPAPEDAPKADEPKADEPTPETATVEGTADVVEIVTETPAPEPAPAEPSVDWEQKFKTLQGKYNKEVGQMGDDLRVMRETMATQSAALAALQAAPPTVEKEADPAPEPEAAITETEVNDFGPDLLDVVGRKAMITLQPMINTIMERLQKLESGVSTVEQTTLKTAQEKVYDALDKWSTANTDWQVINSSDEFKAWLQEADPFAGAQRGALLLDAFNSNDAERVVAFFTGYLKEQTTVSPVTPEPEVPATPSPEPTAQVPLETLVAPGGAPEVAPASAHGDSVGRTFTNAQVAQFYSDVQKGKYRGKETEKDVLEKQIHEAAMHGRVID